jgi:hypothetical protein
LQEPTGQGGLVRRFEGGARSSDLHDGAPDHELPEDYFMRPETGEGASGIQNVGKRRHADDTGNDLEEARGLVVVLGSRFGVASVD